MLAQNETNDVNNPVAGSVFGVGWVGRWLAMGQKPAAWVANRQNSQQPPQRFLLVHGCDLR